MERGGARNRKNAKAGCCLQYIYSQIRILHFIPRIHLLFPSSHRSFSCTFGVSLYLQFSPPSFWYSHSFQPVTQNTCPIPSLHFEWSFPLSLSPVLVSEWIWKGWQTCRVRNCGSGFYIKQKHLCTHTSTHTHTISPLSIYYFVILTKWRKPNSWWCNADAYNDIQLHDETH